MWGIIAAIAGLGLKIWLGMRQSTARLLGRTEARAEAAEDVAKAAKEGARVKDEVSRLPDAAVDDELSKWSKPGRE
jgi:hypothetical protein